MPKFKIDVWFDQQPEKLKLGSVIVEAKDELEAYDLACHKTEQWVVGEVATNQRKL